MKNLFTSIFVVVLVGFVYSGCGDDSSPSSNGGTPQAGSGTASLTLNGAGFTNQSVSFSGVVGGFDSDDTFTGLGGAGTIDDNSVELSIGFPGNSTGTFEFGTDDAGVGINIGSGASHRLFYSNLGGGQLVITAYGNVGGNITGTFSGKLYETTIDGLDSVMVTNGTFSAQRMK